MTATIRERFDSREGAVGKDASCDLRYIVEGTEDDAAVRALIEATAPLTYVDLDAMSYHYAPLGGGVWEAIVRYAHVTPESSGDSTWSFDTGGGTAHITQSYATIGSYAAPGWTAPNHGGAIGVTPDSVEGCDITLPQFSFSETHNLPDSVVTPDYKIDLFALTGCVNSTAFKGFAPGEVLFLGASGSKRGYSETWEVTFRFAASPNMTGITVGTITGIAKNGWDYLWVRYADQENANAIIKRPVAAYVERVYRYASFADLGIG